MNNIQVTVVDYQIGNLLSVERALEYCGAKVVVTSDPEVVRRASHLVLPGVGAFRVGMRELYRRGLTEPLRAASKNGSSILGICLGMQLLMEESEEFGISKGLSLIPGRVVSIPKIGTFGEINRVPHFGWSPLAIQIRDCEKRHAILDGVNENDYVYFAHSYMAKVTYPECMLASTLYGGERIPAIVCIEKIIGCQFHPEKSGEIGLRILKNFVNL